MDTTPESLTVPDVVAAIERFDEPTSATAVRVRHLDGFTDWVDCLAIIRGDLATYAEGDDDTPAEWVPDPRYTGDADCPCDAHVALRQADDVPDDETEADS